MRKQILFAAVMAYWFFAHLLLMQAHGATDTTLAWDAPTETVDGDPIVEPITYRVYMCDQPIADDKTCAGDMQTYDTVDTQTVVTYNPATKKGTLFFRVSAYWTGDLDTESDLSNMISRPFDERGVPRAPANLKRVTP